jgi:2-oxoglutarate dehydrogenase E1 component
MTESSDTFLFAQNATFLEELYNKYLENHELVGDDWRDYFSQIKEDTKDFQCFFSGPSWIKRKDKIIGCNDGVKKLDKKQKTSYLSSNQNAMSLHVSELIHAFRVYGHRGAKLDPLGLQSSILPKELDYKNYEITENELQQTRYVNGIFGHENMVLSELYQQLMDSYSGNFGIEFFHMESLEEREWLRSKIESKHYDHNLGKAKKTKILLNLMKVEMFEKYLNTKFPGAKRFSIEGGENTITAIEEVIEKSVQHEVQEAIFGMAHRGRLSVLTKIIGKAYRAVFSEFKGGIFIPDDLNLPGDVKYHVGSSSNIVVGGKKIHLTLTPNPSHLELVNSVVSGRVRAKQDVIEDTKREKIIGVLLHGDAAFSAQGSVMESLALNHMAAYTIGGTIHIVINNQIGFTTNAKDGRSSRYCTDIAKMISAPIFHVNGDDAEAVLYVSGIAAEYRAKFKKDVFIDIVCYRKYGHNEGDEPMFTQPKMYNVIHNHKTPYTIYSEKLLQSGDITAEEIEKSSKKFKAFLDEEFELSKTYKTEKADWLHGIWKGFDAFLTDKNKHTATGVDKKDIKTLAKSLTDIPQEFKANSKIERLFESRRAMAETGEHIDWGMGEALAYATLLKEGYKVRLTGEDVERGTFSHRHAVIIDQENENRYTPLNNLGKNQKATFEIHNSILSELAVMGFEYGYSYSSPNSLVIWEAQFGDFANSAQMLIDQYVVSGKAKWLRMSSLVLLLPHGYEGQGPEHSSARLERYLQLCANNNITVANCTTPASMFHLLRRQMHRNYRKPLIVMTPKSLLRHKLSVSKLEEFLTGTYFKHLIEDDLKVDNIKKVLFCSGKVYYDLFEERARLKRKDVALIRLEQIYPYPKDEVLQQLKKYKNAKQLIWCQEEHKNMGAWSYVNTKFDEVSKEAKSKLKIEYVGRDESASPAAGYMKLHLAELSEFLNRVFE